MTPEDVPGRISSPVEIVSIRRSGKQYRGRFVRIWAARGAGGKRVAVTCGRGFKGAVSRNLAKRRVRGCIMELRPEMTPGTDFVVECRPGAEGADYQNLVNDVRELFRRAGKE